MKYCMKCGSQLPENAAFCPACGTAAGSTGAENRHNTYQASPYQSSGLTAKATGIVAYLTWIGFIIALLVGDKEGAKFHINQALVINLFWLATGVPVLGWLWSIFMLVVWIMGLVYACNQEQKEVPLIGKIRILN